MSAFDPDAYLADASGDFDPDAYLREEDEPGMLEATLRSVAQGFTGNFADEIGAGASALAAKVGGDERPIGEIYGSERDESRENFRRAEEAHPGISMTGEVVGGALTGLIPGLGAVRTLKGAAALGAGLGAAQGLGASEADLLEGEVGEAAVDAGLGGLVGAGAGALGHAVGKGVEAIRGRAARGIGKAVADQEALATKATDEAIASAQGKYRSGVQSASRDLEVLGREAAALPGEVGERAASFIDSPQGLSVREQVAANKLTTAPERISEMEQLRAAHAALAGNREQEIARRTAEGLKDPIRRQFAPRLATLGHRLLPAALAGLGGAMGGPEGAAVGTGLGAVMALTQGRPGIIIRNLIRSPASRKLLWEWVDAAAGSGALQNFGPMLQGAARTMGIEGAQALHEALLSERPEYTDELGRLLLETGGAE
jgi:hypothetical protein